MSSWFDRVQKSVSLVFHFLGKRSGILAFCIIFVVITLSSIPPLTSGKKLNFDNDFFQYASRHEAVRKSILEYHTFPLRSHWFGGGYPTLGDPEDPSLNPFVLLSILFGTVTGLKLIGFLGLLVGGLSTYALARYVLGYTRWGALFCGLIFGTSLFVPLRLRDGNPNEIYAAFLPLCLLLIGLAYRGRIIALVILPFVFYTMLSDGKLTCFMGMFYIGILCLLNIFPVFNTFTPSSQKRVDFSPLKILLFTLTITFFIGMIRILPALEVISAKGGLSNVELYFYPETYEVKSYEFQRFWKELVNWKGEQDLVTIGWVPIILFGAALLTFWRKSVPWAITLALFAWLLLADKAPIDLFRPLWKLPIFNAVRQPYKYFSFQVVFSIVIASGQIFTLLKRIRFRWLEHLIAIVLIVSGLVFLYPRMAKIQRETYEHTYVPSGPVQEEFFNVKGKELERNREKPPRAVTYFNVLRNIGTVDWYTGIPIEEDAIPRYFVDRDGNYIPNPEYRGEAFFLRADDMTDQNGTPNTAKAVFRPNSIAVQVDVQSPGILVINQNYHRGWHTDRGELSNRNGLISLRLQDTGSYTIHLRYIPRSFYTGLIVSIFSFVIFGLICWAYATGRLLKYSKDGSSVLRMSSKAILWMIDHKTEVKPQ